MSVPVEWWDSIVGTSRKSTSKQSCPLWWENTIQVNTFVYPEKTAIRVRMQWGRRRYKSLYWLRLNSERARKSPTNSFTAFNSKQQHSTLANLLHAAYSAIKMYKTYNFLDVRYICVFVGSFFLQISSKTLPQGISPLLFCKRNLFFTCLDFLIVKKGISTIRTVHHF